MQLGRAMYPFSGFAACLKETEFEDFTTKCRLVELMPQDLLIGLLQFGEGEQFRQQVAGQGRIGGLVAQPFDRGVDDAIVVKGELGQVVGRQKEQALRILDRDGIKGQKRVVADAGRPAARVAGGAGKGVELFQVRRDQAQFFPQYPTGCGLAVDILLGVDITAGQGRLAEIRLLVPFLQNNLEKVLGKGKKHHVHGENNLLIHFGLVAHIVYR